MLTQQVLGEKLLCGREPDNVVDYYAVAVKKAYSRCDCWSPTK